MNIADEMSLGGLVSNNEVANVTILGGDLFVREQVNVNNQLKVTTGGVFAIGGDMTPNRTPVVKSGVGAGKTILTYPANGNSIISSRAVEASAVGIASSLVTAGVTTQTDALGRKLSYSWSDRFLLKEVALPDQTSRTYDY